MLSRIPPELVVTILLLIFVAVPIWLARKVCKLKGFNPNWSWIALFVMIGIFEKAIGFKGEITGPLSLLGGIFFIVIGLIKAKPDLQLQKTKTWSIVSIVVGIILTLLQLLLMFKS